MNREDIIRMAIEAGLNLYVNDLTEKQYIEVVERFAALIASAEREACAKVCEEGIANADDWNSAHWDQACENRAWAIRARGQA